MTIFQHHLRISLVWTIILFTGCASHTIQSHPELFVKTSSGVTKSGEKDKFIQCINDGSRKARSDWVTVNLRSNNERVANGYRISLEIEDGSECFVINVLDNEQYEIHYGRACRLLSNIQAYQDILSQCIAQHAVNN